VYCPIDVSASALLRSERDLADIPGLKIVPLQRSFTEGLAAASQLRKPGTPLLVLFLGSSIGNFDPHAAVEFLSSVRRGLRRGDMLLLSCDLVKSPDLMLRAYNDAVGVTAAFNLNLLARINRELGSNFNLKLFRHEVRYDESTDRIEMHLRSLTDQMVMLNGGVRVKFKHGETIWTESSYKFRPEGVIRMAQRAGFKCQDQWIDSEWPFAQTVLYVPR
jgi:dimethylhistidine N-methyltransferase